MITSNVEVVIQNDNAGSVEGVSQEIQQPNRNSINNQTIVQKKLFVEMAELLSSSAFGAGVGYLAGGMIRVIVDLAKNGITEVQKKSQEEGLQENTSRYIGINDYTVTGLSIGATVGALTYLCVSELIKQRKEAEMELRDIREGLEENGNFDGALSGRQVNRIVLNGGANSEHYGHVIEGEITYENGGSLPDGNRNPQSIMTIGMRFQETNSMQSREGSIAPSDNKQESQSEELKNPPSEARDQEIKKTTKQQDDGVGVFLARRSQAPRPSIEQDRSISAPNPEPEIPSAYASALQSLKSPRDSVRSSQAMETHKDLHELKRDNSFCKVVQTFKEKAEGVKSR